MSNRSIGVALLCILLIAAGGILVLSLTFNSMNIILGIAAGILILAGR